MAKELVARMIDQRITVQAVVNGGYCPFNNSLCEHVKCMAWMEISGTAFGICGRIYHPDLFVRWIEG